MISVFGRATVNISCRTTKSAFFNDRNSNSVSYRQFHQFVTLYARKPMWLPIAKSKLFKVPERRVLPADEFEEIEYHKKNYDTLMNSLVELQMAKDRETMKKYNIKMKSTEEEILEMFAKNEPINKLIAQQREEAQELEWSMTEEKILKKKEYVENVRIKKELEREEFIKSEIARLETALKLEDLDEVIAKAMGNVTDYNYAIDLKGNYYHGRYTTPPPVNK